MSTEIAPASMYRTTEGLGAWEHKGKVAVVGIGVSPTARRWDETTDTSLGAWSILALQRAMEDAGISPDQVDGLVMAPDTSTGSPWPANKPVPEDFLKTYQSTDNPLDGIARLSSEWLLKNMPELSNVNFTMYGPGCMSNSLVVAAQAVGEGLTEACLVLKGWHNFGGRYYVGQGAAAGDTVSGQGKWSGLWGTVACYNTAMIFEAYCRKYGKNHDMMAPFVVNEKRNGLLYPEGFWAQHRPEPLTVEDYLAARWIAKPANLFDNDLPIMVSGAFLITTPERAKDLRQKPVYILNHTRTLPATRGVVPTLEEWQDASDSTGRKLYEGAGIGPSDLSFENMYDGFTLFHQFHLEGLRFAGVQRGEALDFYQTDISIEGPNPASPSGGNAGSGRTRFWLHMDSVLQLQGRAGARQIKKKAETGVSGAFFPDFNYSLVWSATPD
ncbi:MAG: thiolase family protein [Dehalococcoidia bacterium]|nr:thiolase family protein [Dehalococcoidia bacterium]